MEAQLSGGKEVIVVGGGNSAGQAAVFLADYKTCTHMLVKVLRFDCYYVAVLDS